MMLRSLLTGVPAQDRIVDLFGNCGEQSATHLQRSGRTAGWTR